MGNRVEYKKLARVMLGGACAQCGATEALDFDHIDPMTKTCRTQDVFKGSWARVKRELPLLQLLCRPCHNEKSRQDRWTKAGQRPYWEHGTISGYFVYGCREDCCRLVANAYNRQRRAARKANHVD